MLRIKNWWALSVILFLATRVSGQPTETTRIYWTHDSPTSISSASPIGGSRQIFSGVIEPVAPWGIAIDRIERKIYWSNLSPNNSIQRANLDGTETETIYQGTSSNSPLGLDVDPIGKKLYWVDDRTDDVKRSNLDGSGIETLFHAPGGIAQLGDVAVDPFNGKLYWTNNQNPRIFWSNLDGSMPSQLIQLSAGGFRSLSIDYLSEHLYFTTFNTPRIARANLDGTDITNILIGSSVVQPEAIAVDPLAGKMYWTEINGSRIRRANLDGTQIETIVSSVSLGRRLAIDGWPIPEPTTMMLFISGIAVAALNLRPRYT